MHSFVFFLVACGSDNALNGKDQADAAFEEDTDFTLGGDTDGVTEDTDTGEVTLPGEDCAGWDGSREGSALTVRDECDAPPSASPTWELTPLWTNEAVVNTYGGLTSVANLTDDNGDGEVDQNDSPDVVYAPWYGDIVALDGLTGELIWDSNSGGTEQGIPAIGDVDGDGFPEVAVTSLMWTRLYNGQDGSLIWEGSGPTGTKTECGGAGLADLDGDGTPELFHGRQIYDVVTGDVIAEGRYGYGTGYSGESPSSIAADVDLDGDQEVVVGNAVYDINGDSDFHTGGEDGFPAVGNFDDDPQAEIVSVGRTQTTLIDDDGSEIWSVTNTGGFQPAAPAIADFDGDGEPEIAYLMGGDAIVLDADGTELWRAEGAPVVWVGELTAADLDDDGAYELLTGTKDGLTVYDGRTGDVLSTYETGYMMCGANPVFADVDGDGRGEIMLSGPDIGVVALTDPGGFGGGATTWNEGGFSVTNIADDLTIPADPVMNWEAGYNSFRAAPPASELVPGGNLLAEIVDVCADECASGNLYVSFQLGNDGVADIDGGVPLEIWGATGSEDVLLWTGTWNDTLVSGQLATSLTAVITGAPAKLYDLWVVADAGDTVSECAEDDNRASWGQEVCG